MTEQEIRKYLRRIEEENSQTALRSFYNLCFDRFFRIAYYYLHTEEWAQEVVLDVFLKIWERRESLHHIANLEDYFFHCSVFKDLYQFPLPSFEAFHQLAT